MKRRTIGVDLVQPLVAVRTPHSSISIRFTASWAGGAAAGAPADHRVSRAASTALAVVAGLSFELLVGSKFKAF
jgi:hypothetical protein